MDHLIYYFEKSFSYDIFATDSKGLLFHLMNWCIKPIKICDL